MLVVDDCPQKVSTVKSALVEYGIREVDIFVAHTASQARRYLVSNNISIMLLDVLLPVREGQRPVAETSLDLLIQILDEKTLPCPQHIAAITADVDALKLNEDAFRQLVTVILHISPGASEWKGALQNLVWLAGRVETPSNSYDYDACFITALRTPELQQLLKATPIKWGPEVLVSKSLLCRHGVLEINRESRRFVCAHAPSMGLVAATHTAKDLIRIYRPKVVGMSGICGGVSGDLEIGDIVVADKSWDWQSGKWGADGDLHISPDQKDASSELVTLSLSNEQYIRDWAAGFDGNKPLHCPRIFVGPMPSGSSVVTYRQFHEIFKQQHRKVVGVDMECYGIYYAVAQSYDPAPKVVCIKSVSDLADQHKGDDFQGFCSYISAKLLFETVVSYLS